MLDFNPAREVGYYLHNEYPTADEKLEVRLYGKLNKILARTEFDEQSFLRLSAGLNPETGKRLTARLDKNRDTGTDITANVPKELAVIIEVMGDRRAKEALWKAWEATIKRIECDACVRVRKAGKGGNRVTGNLACDAFYHSATRPTKEDGLPDPHPHIHGFVHNLTFDKAEGKVKAAKLDYIDKPKAERYFHTRLAKEMRAIGYEARLVTRERSTTVKIKGFDQEVLDRYSRRHFEVEKNAAERGYKSAKAKATLAQATRQEKNTDISMSEVRDYWKSRVSESQLNGLRSVVSKSKRKVRRDADHDASRSYVDTARRYATQELMNERGIER